MATQSNAGASGPSPTSWANLRRELEAEGIRPTKTLGQNFLCDPNLARAMVRDAGIQCGDRVLEVGPGCGFLTVPMAELGVDLIAVEIDERLLRIVQRAVGERDNVQFLCMDVLAGKHRLAQPVDEALWNDAPWHLVANLPYAISGPLIALLAMRDSAPESMTILVQSEMAERFAATPGSASYGALSVRLGLRYRATLGRKVGAQLFWPKPRVESRVVRLERLPSGVHGPIGSEELALFNRLVEGLFQRRRKTIRAGLSAILGDRAQAELALADSDLDPAVRPESLAAGEFVRLTRVLSIRN